MPSISMRQLLEAGVHFGHQTRRWNPKMRPFIFAERNGIHIIDLAQTTKRLEVALDFVRETVARGDVVLLVGTGDTNVDPDELDYIIPANDDAIRAIRLLCSLVADAAIEGAQERANRAVEPEPEPMIEEPAYDDAQASDALVAALAGGAALSFAPDEDEDLLPGAPVVAAPEEAATPEEIAAELAREAAEAAASDGGPAAVTTPAPIAAATESESTPG